MTARLLVDAGNTRVKWVVVDGASWSEPGFAHYSDLTDLAASLRPDMVVHLASVASETQRACLDACLNTLPLAVHEITTGESFADLENGYDQPGQLGVDRWMALVGARARTASAVLVVSAGTALTVDALSASGRFLGGLILPGRELMRRALLTGTARINAAPGHKRDFPTNTLDAVESGIMEAMAGAIRSQRDRLASVSGRMPGCYLTGGDAVTLMAHLDGPVEHLPTLVLEGIDRVAREGWAG